MTNAQGPGPGARESLDTEILVLLSSLMFLLVTILGEPFDGRLCALGVMGLFVFAWMMRRRSAR